MSASTFFSKVSGEIDTLKEFEVEVKKTQGKKMREEEEKRRIIIEKINELEQKVKIRASKVSKVELSIDKNNLLSEMEETMILHSNIIDDIFDLKIVLEEMKVILNSLVGYLHHTLKFENQYKLKTTKEIETYIAKDQTYNMVNIKIKRIQSMIERCENNSGLIKQKIGFIRDLTKMRTQELFGEK